MATSTTCIYEGNQISIEEALTLKQEGIVLNLICIECGQSVRPHLGGGHTKAHFEHTQRNAECSLSHNSKYYKFISTSTTEIADLQSDDLVGEEGYYFRKQRINQGIFRQRMLKLWGSCCISGVRNSSFLIASHIKPWSKCSAEEKLSINNGLLLIASYDFLFDNFYLTFSDTGKGILSDIGKEVSQHFGIIGEVHINRSLNSEQKSFLKYHREEFYKR